MDGLNIGTLFALLTLKDEMSPALQQASANLQTTASTFSTVGSQMTSAGLALTAGITVPIVGIGYAAITAAIEFESSFAGVIKTVDGVIDEFGNLTAVGADLQQGLRDLALEIPISVNELARIAEVGGQLGVAAEDLLFFTRVAADMGVSTVLSSDEAALGLARLANITGVVAEEGVIAYSRLGSAIVDLGNNFATNEAEILEFGLRLAGVGTIVGMSAGEILGLSAVLASVGINAEAGGTAMARVLVELANAAESGGEKLSAFADVAGMTDAAFATLFQDDPAAALLKFVEGLAAIDAEGGNVFATLESVEFQDIRVRQSLLLTLLAVDKLRLGFEMGNEAYAENIALAEEAGRRYATTESQLTIFWNRVNDVWITLGGPLAAALITTIDLLTPLIIGLGSAVEWWAAWPQPIQMVQIAFAGVLAVIGPLLTAIGFMGTGVSALITAYNTLTGATVAAAAATTAASVATQTMPLLFDAYGKAVATTATATTVAVTSTNYLAAALGLLGKAVAVVSVAWAAWELGSWIGNMDAVRDKTSQYLAILGELIGLLPVGTANQIEATNAAARLAAETGALLGPTRDADISLDAMGTTAAGTVPKIDAAAAAQTRYAEEIKKLVAQFSGTDLLASAQQYEAVLAQIGGTSNLTSAEQQKFVDVFDAVITKYREMGPAGEAVVAHYEALREQVKPALESTAMAAMMLIDGIHGVTVALEGANDSITGFGYVLVNGEALISSTTMSTDMFRLAMNAVPASIRDTGQATIEVAESMKTHWTDAFQGIPEMLTAVSDGVAGALSEVDAAWADSVVKWVDIGAAALTNAMTGNWVGLAVQGATILGGLIVEGFRTAGEDVVRRVGTDWGIMITEEMGDAIADTAGDLFDGDRMAAEIYHMADLIQEAGGVTAENFSAMIGKLRDVFVMLQTGVFDASQATQVLDENWQSFVDGALDGTNLLGSSMLEIIALTRQFGLESAAINAYVIGETQQAIAGLDTFMENSAIRTEAGALAVSASIAAMFLNLQASGMTAREALEALIPTFDTLEQKLADSGFSDGGLLDAFRAMADLATDETFGPMLDAIEGLNQAMIGLHNSGMLTEGMFTGLAGEVAALYSELLAGGADHLTSLQMMQPTLQTIWEMQNRFGYAVDEATQALLDEAEAIGIVGAAHMSVDEQIRDILLAIAEALGATLPEGLRAFEDQAIATFGAIQDAWDPSLESSDYVKFWQDFYASALASDGGIFGTQPETMPDGYLTPQQREDADRAALYAALAEGGGSYIRQTINIENLNVNGANGEALATDFLKQLGDGGTAFSVFRDMVCEVQA